MTYKLDKVSEYKRVLKTEKMKAPAVFFTAQKIKAEILESVEKTAANEKISKEIAVLSDAHLKRGITNPEGSIVISDKYILPQMLDAAPNCGMRVIKTDFTENDLSGDKIDKLFSKLAKEIPTKKYFGTKIPLELARKVLTQGSIAIKDYFGFRTKNEIERTFRQGNFFNNPLLQKFQIGDISEIVPDIFIKMSRYRLGILGATDSHSIALARVESIMDSEAAEKTVGLKEGQYVFTMHTGSGIIGRYISYLYSPQKMRLIHKIPVMIGALLFSRKTRNAYLKIRNILTSFENSPAKFGFPMDLKDGQMCLGAMCAAGNVGFANRAVLTHKLDLALEKYFGRQIDLELIKDTPHVFMDREGTNGDEFFIYRNGAVSASENEMVYVAPFMGTYGYIGVGTAENEDTYRSANHEIGKLEDIDPDYLEKLPAGKNDQEPIIVYKSRKKTLLAPEKKHQLYAEEIIKEMEANKIVKIVAKLKPIAVLTY